MQDDSIHKFDELTRRLQTVQKGVIRVQAIRDTLLNQMEQTLEKTDKVSRSLDQLTKGGELLRKLMDLLVLDQVKNIESVITEGLRAIFDDQVLEFKAEVGQFRNKMAIDLMVQATQNGVEIVGAPLDSFGGGVASIVSLLLRLLTLLRLKKYPFFVLDETLSAVSDDYVDATGQFLAKLAKTSDVPILLVTHKQAFLDHATRAYQGVESPTETLALKQIR
jgi:hypothetical protein